MRQIALFLPLLALLAPAQERLRVDPAPARPFSLTVEGDTGRTMIAAPTATPPGRYTATLGGQSWTLDVAPPPPIPASIHPPVVLLNGYQFRTITSACPVRPSTSAFGRLQSLLEATGRPVLFFDNCRECPGGSIEECARALKEFLDVQRTQAGDPVREFDLIGHSMGGLIARAYLAGMFPDGWFPPLPHRVRKLVLIATPNFGAYTIAGIDTQTRQLLEGRQFQWDLATWHQGADDLRGVDALAIAGAAHNGSGDGTVSLISASLAFAREPARTRVLDYCHNSSIAQLPFCGFRRTGLAEIDDHGHLGWQIIEPFLSDRDDWRFVGRGADEDPWLGARGGGIGYVLSAEGQPLAEGPSQTRALEPGPVEFPFRAPGGGEFSYTTDIGAGGIYPRLFKFGPVVGRVDGEFTGRGLEIVSGQRIRILGHHLEDARVWANGEELELLSSNGEQIEVWLPLKFFGLVWLEVRTPGGAHLVRIIALRPAQRITGPAPTAAESPRAPDHI